MLLVHCRFNINGKAIAIAIAMDAISLLCKNEFSVDSSIKLDIVFIKLTENSDLCHKNKKKQC